MSWLAPTIIDLINISGVTLAEDFSAVVFKERHDGRLQMLNGIPTS